MQPVWPFLEGGGFIFFNNFGQLARAVDLLFSVLLAIFGGRQVYYSGPFRQFLEGGRFIRFAHFRHFQRGVDAVFMATASFQRTVDSLFSAIRAGFGVRKVYNLGPSRLFSEYTRSII